MGFVPQGQPKRQGRRQCNTACKIVTTQLFVLPLQMGSTLLVIIVSANQLS